MTAASAASPPAFRPPAPPVQTGPVGPLRAIAILRRNPLELWSHAHYERPFLQGRTILGDRAVVSDPAAVRRVFLDNAANYRKDELQLRVLRPGLGNGLLTAEGEEWRAQRRTLAPLFSPRQIGAFTPAMHDVADSNVERLRRRRARILDVSEEMGRLALEMLEHTLFSQGLGRDPTDFQRGVTRYFETAGRIDPLDLFGMPKFIPRLGQRRAQDTLRFFARAVDDIIRARRELLSGGGEAPRDILALLLDAQDPDTGRGMSEEDVRANIVTFIGAGHETTANALTWTLYLLSQAPEWRARVEAEIDNRFDPARRDASLDDLPVTRAVLDEALRLYPPAAILSREAIDSDVLCGNRIRAGTVVTVAPFVLHRHKLLWRNPELFDPSRFLPGERERIDRFSYIPFGAGPRVCIGMGFAVTEAMVTLAHLLRAFRFDLVRGHPVEPVQRITLRPRHGMRMVLHERNAA